MSSRDAVFRQIQSVARSATAKCGTAAPRHRGTDSGVRDPTHPRIVPRSAHAYPHAGDFVLKGGVLLAAYGVRRPTKDADANAVRAGVTTEHLAHVVRDVAAIDVDDGVVFDLDTINARQIRKQADYPGFRVQVGVSIGPWTGNPLRRRSRAADGDRNVRPVR